MTQTLTPTSPSTRSASQIKRGVSLYSFQEEFFLRKMTLENCVAACADMALSASRRWPSR